MDDKVKSILARLSNSPEFSEDAAFCDPGLQVMSRASALSIASLQLSPASHSTQAEYSIAHIADNFRLAAHTQFMGTHSIQFCAPGSHETRK